MCEVRSRKERVCLYLNKETVEKWRSLINSKYQKYAKGLLSNEAELAITHWLSLHTDIHKELKIPPPVSKVEIKFMMIKEWLLRNFYEELHRGQEIPKLHMESAINAVCGSDPRTVKKWVEVFYKMGFIKPVNSALLKIF